MPTPEKHKRSIVKSITFRILVIISDMVIITLVTHRYDVALGITIATNLGSTVLYYLHERVWTKIAWGRAV
jgi:uncharacterized membrane protein